MAYTNVWSNTFPPGTELANKLDDFLRQLRLDIAERMESVLIEDATADPWVLKDGIAQKTGNILVIPFCSFITSLGRTTDYENEGYVHEQYTFYAPVILPAGATITKIEMMMDKQSNAAINWNLTRREFGANPGPAEAWYSTIHNTAGIALSDTGVIAEVISASKYYWITVQSPATEDVRIYAAKITYDY